MVFVQKNEILSKFDIDGISSKVSFFDKLLEETKIRLHNNQNFLFVIFLMIVHSLNKLLNLIFKK